jgi:uncharacterized membrane protein
MDGLLFAATLATALGCGLVAGVLFAFSSFVMPALARLDPAQGIAAMQAINVKAVTAPFMLAFCGTAAGVAALFVVALVQWHEPYAVYLVVGSVLYLIGTFGLTRGYHVPRNDALDAVDPHAPDAAAHWTRYLADWTRWNHVRAAATLAAAAALTGALTAG